MSAELNVTELRLRGLKLITPQVSTDPRGFVFESFQTDRYLAHGIDCTFVQDNHSRSLRGALRGLHYQAALGQAKLVRVASGAIFDVAVDLRPESATFGHWQGVQLDGEGHAQLFIPAGFAHGFCVLSERADVLYKLSTAYDPARECTLAFDDPDVGVRWPVSDPLLSERDRSGQSLASIRATLYG
jgi:dTDP-4-dehydrorhamnose 3,5-epimerase